MSASCEQKKDSNKKESSDPCYHHRDGVARDKDDGEVDLALDLLVAVSIQELKGTGMSQNELSSCAAQRVVRELLMNSGGFCGHDGFTMPQMLLLCARTYDGDMGLCSMVALFLWVMARQARWRS